MGRDISPLQVEHRTSYYCQIPECETKVHYLSRYIEGGIKHDFRLFKYFIADPRIHKPLITPIKRPISSHVIKHVL